MHQVILGLGSNLGDRQNFIELAIAALNDHPNIDVVQQSKTIETPAVARVKQPDYLNAAAVIETPLDPEDVLKITQNIETNLGRTSKGSGDPRTIDIDILFVEQDLICSDTLTVPHPLLHERAFVLAPLKEMVPFFIHPIFQETITKLHDRIVGY